MDANKVLGQYQRALLHRFDQAGEPRLHTRKSDGTAFPIVVKGQKLARCAAIFGGDVQAQVIAGAVVQEGYPASPPPVWIVEIRRDHAIEQLFRGGDGLK